MMMNTYIYNLDMETDKNQQSLNKARLLVILANFKENLLQNAIQYIHSDLSLLLLYNRHVIRHNNTKRITGWNRVVEFLNIAFRRQRKYVIIQGGEIDTTPIFLITQNIVSVYIAVI